MRFCKFDKFSDSGSPVKTVYSPVVKSDGSIDLQPSGKENTDDFIQSFAESTDMAFILAQLANGDTSVLNRGSPLFGDFTSMPKTFAELLQLHIDSDNAYDRLPVELKQKFDNDKNKFFASAGSKEWFEKLGVVPDPGAVQVTQDVIEKESKE